MTFKGYNPWSILWLQDLEGSNIFFLISCSNESDPYNCLYRAKALHFFESDQVKNIIKSFYNILKVIFTVQNCGIGCNFYRFHPLKLSIMLGYENELTADHALISMLIFAYKSW